VERFSREILEYPQLKELVGRFVATALGRSRLEAVQPSANRLAIEYQLADMEEALRYTRQAQGAQAPQRGAASRLRFSGVPDVRDAAALLRIEGSVLDGEQLRDLLAFLDQAEEIRSLLWGVQESYPRLHGYARRMGSFEHLTREFSGKINPDGTLADHASVALQRLRRDMERQRGAIQSSLEKFLKTHERDGTLQEDFVTLRNDRFVVPIIAGQKGRVDGVVHSTSGTGRTLFLEPLETIGLNNELVRLRDEEMREVHRILRDITDRLRRQAKEIRDTIETYADLEFLFAKADFGAAFDCCIPSFSGDERELKLREARHPLLEDVLRKDRKRVVPFTLALDAVNRMLLISGPNTGGKTVTLKTAGLLALMAQSAMPVPAREAVLPVFDQVLADLGDNQSITESLSSFSAHMSRVKTVEESATHESLVILDELGRATDPEEGGALGVALLEQFQRIGSMTMVSTHLLPMKVFGANTDTVVNACMGFDDSTLQPTYELRLGVPGKSAAIDIASRLGVPPAIILRARQNLTTSERDIAAFLAELHQKLSEIGRQQRALDELRGAVERERGELEREMKRREERRLEQIERDAARLVAEFEKESRQTLEELAQLKESRKQAENAMRSVARLKREFQEQVTGIRQADPEAPPKPKVEEQPIEVGMRVRLRDVRDPARVRKVFEDGRIEVEAGFMRLQVSREDVREVLPAGETPKPKNVHVELGPKWNTTYREINLVGQRAEEAVDAADKFLDDASLAGVDRVRIVHGFGMGVLRKAISRMLERNPHVGQFYAAPPSEGGAGATIVELK
jgi:DNA mismatch repair protein MutS2